MAECTEFLMCAQVSVHVTAHRSNTDLVIFVEPFQPLEWFAEKKDGLRKRMVCKCFSDAQQQQLKESELCLTFNSANHL